jgi:hypothetical protein
LSFNKKYFCFLTIGIFIILINSCADKKTEPKKMTENKFDPIELNDWKKVPFTKGRLATKKDIDLGKAIFQIEGNGEEHIPLEIEIPSLAYHIDQETNEKTKVVVIQGEQVGTKKVIGIRYLNGGDGVCLLFELEFIKL